MKKKLNYDEKIRAALNALNMSICNLDELRSRYNDYMDEAALRGDDARATQIIKQKMKLSELIRQFETLKGNIKLGAYTAQAMSELGKLPAAIAGCKGLLAEMPDFSKLGKDIASIYKDIGESESEIGKLNKIFEPIPVESTSSRLNGASEDETSDEFKAEHAEMIERIKLKINPISTDAKGQTDPVATGAIDYLSIVAEENKKK
jgi:hypothetical protein